MNIQGKSALVTGGASGLGAATVRMLAAKGAKVMIADINEQAGNALAQELGAAAAFVKMDVTKQKDVQNAVTDAAAHHGGLHILVTTAAIGVAEKDHAKNVPHDLQKIIRVIQVNHIGTLY